MSDPGLEKTVEHEAANAAERELLRGFEDRTHTAANAPRTHTLATAPLPGGYSAGKETIQPGAALKMVELAKAEHERARRAINQMELERQVLRASTLEKFRVRAEELMAERERALAQIERDHETRVSAPMDLMRVSSRLFERTEEAVQWTRN
jgi:hypothetical protein